MIGVESDTHHTASCSRLYRCCPLCGGCGRRPASPEQHCLCVWSGRAVHSHLVGAKQRPADQHNAHVWCTVHAPGGPSTAAACTLCRQKYCQTDSGSGAAMMWTHSTSSCEGHREQHSRPKHPPRHHTAAGVLQGLHAELSHLMAPAERHVHTGGPRLQLPWGRPASCQCTQQWPCYTPADLASRWMASSCSGPSSSLVDIWA